MTRTHLLQTKLNDAEFKLFEVAAKAQGLPVAALVRTAIMAYIGAPGGAPSVHERLRALEDQVRALYALAGLALSSESSRPR